MCLICTIILLYAYILEIITIISVGKYCDAIFVVLS